LRPVVENAEKANGNEMADNLEEVSVSDHATTGSNKESDIDTKVRTKVSYKDIQAPDGTYLHQHAKLKTLHLRKSENRRGFCVDAQQTAVTRLLKGSMLLIHLSAVSAFVQS